MRRLIALFVIVGVAALGSCRDDGVLSPELLGPQHAILDAAHGGDNPDFFFLPPLVPNPSSHPDFEEEEFNPDLRPVVEICELTLENLDENGNPTDGTPCAPEQPQGFPITFTMGEGPDSETVKVSSAHYEVNWHTDQFELDQTLFYRIHVRVGATELGLADVDVLSSGRELRNVKTDEVVGLVDGRTLPIRFRIETGALCDPPGTKPCASATFDLAEGGSVVLEETGDRVDLPPQETLPEGVTEITVTLQICDGIDVDLPTFGNCLEITSDPALDETTVEDSQSWDGLSPRAVISVCSLIDSSELPADPQRDLVTLHRQNDAGDVQALPHAHSFCEGEPQSASLRQGGVRGLAARGLDLLRQGVARIGSPRPLHARGRALRLDVGHAGESDLLSKFQFALPAQMEVVEETNHQTAEGGTAVAEAPTVYVSDRDGNPVAGATVGFQVIGADGSVSPGSVDSDASGLARVDAWVLGAATGTYRLRAFGRGIAGKGDEGPFMPDTDLPTSDQEPVTLATGEVTFTAAACESDPCAVGTINLEEGGSVVIEETGDRLDIPPQDTFPEGVTEVTVTIELCDGIDVDLPTFGNCLEITSEPALDETTVQESQSWDGLFPRAVISMCSLIDSGALPPEPQRDLVTLHRQNDDGDVQALPHAHSFCDEETQVGGAWDGSFRGLAHRAVGRLREGARWLGSPTPLMASGPSVRLDVGHAGESDLLSKFQFALPAKMTALQDTDDQTAQPGGTVETPPGVLVTDADDQPVEGATVHFEVTEGAGTVGGSSTLSVTTLGDGIAQVPSWVLGPGPGPNRVTASGAGIAGPDDDPFMPDLSADTEEQEAVEVGEGSVEFGATAADLIAFNRGPPEDRQIFVVFENGMELTNLTNLPGTRNEFPKWSPDGTRIAFASTRHVGGGAEADLDVYVMDADGSNVVRLTDTGTLDRPHGWSPDGTRVTITSDRSGPRSVWVIDAADGGNPELLAENGGSASFSPDGTRIVFERLVVHPDPNTGEPVLRLDTWIMDGDGSNQVNFTDDVSDHDARPSWGPDGERIAITRAVPEQPLADIWIISATNVGQFLANLTGEPGVDPEFFNSHPAWHPNPSRIAFHSNRDGQFEIYIMNDDGSGPVRVTFDPAFDGHASWKPRPTP